MISCLVLSRYGLAGPSSRVRFGEYFGALASDGIRCHLSPLLTDDYLPLRYSGDSRRYWIAAGGYLKRLRTLLTTAAYDVAWVEGELFPGLPAAFESLLAMTHTPYVVDYDDALFHKYDRLLAGPGGWFYKDKFRRLLSRAKAVTAGNAYLEALSRQHGATLVTRVPSVVNLERYVPQRTAKTADGPLIIGWIGSPTTTKYLRLIEPVLLHLAEGLPLRLMTVGAAPLPDYAVPVDQHPWTLESEVRLINAMDIGIMPLADESWERGKCGYKLIQYMALAKPVVASPVGVNSEIVSHGVNGFLATTEQEWLDALRGLAVSPERRLTMGVAGRERVEAHYCVQAQVSAVAEVLRAAARGND